MSDNIQTPPQRRASLFGPLLLIGLGVIFLLSNLKILPGDAWDIFLRLWPLLLIFGGLDSLYKREGIVGPVFGICLGAVFLLANLGYLALDVWGVILRLWPVLIIAAGFDLLLGRRSIWASLAGLVAVLAIVGGSLWFWGMRAESSALLNTQEIQQSAAGATQARVTLDPRVGSVKLAALTDGSWLIAGQVMSGRKQNIDQDLTLQDGIAVYRLRQIGNIPYNFNFDTNNWRWDLKLTPNLPIDLKVDLGVGSTDLDLRGLDLSALKIDLGVGQTTVILPAQGQFEGDIDGGIGSLVIKIPAGTAVRILADTGISGRSFPSEYIRNGDTYTSPGYDTASERIDLKLNLGIGFVRVIEISQ